MNDLRDTFTSESGISTLVSMCIDGRLFEPIRTTSELNVHNYMIAKFQKLGLCNANLKSILEFATRLPEVKDVGNDEIVYKAYFGENPEVKL